jgi:hypothetical protein
MYKRMLYFILIAGWLIFIGGDIFAQSTNESTVQTNLQESSPTDQTDQKAPSKSEKRVLDDYAVTPPQFPSITTTEKQEKK